MLSNWIVTRDWDGYESAIDEFRNKEEAIDFYNEWNEISDATIHLAKVERTNKYE